MIKHRKGLSALLKDVAGGKAKFRVILVYEPSAPRAFSNVHWARSAAGLS
jgi:hypothetical protein